MCVCVCVCVCVSCRVTLINSWPFVFLNDCWAITPTHKLSATAFPPIHTHYRITDIHTHTHTHTHTLTHSIFTTAPIQNTYQCAYTNTEKHKNKHVYTVQAQSWIHMNSHIDQQKTQTHTVGDTPAATSWRNILPQEIEPLITVWTLWGSTKEIHVEHSLGHHTATQTHTHTTANHTSPKSPARLNVHLKIHTSVAPGMLWKNSEGQKSACWGSMFSISICLLVLSNGPRTAELFQQLQ